jgi:hypothetical protein
MSARRRTFKPTEHDLETEGKPSASAFDAEFRCLGKRALCAQLPHEAETKYAASGHRIHEALKESDLEGLSDSEQRTASRIMYGESEIVHEYGFEGSESTFEERVWDFDDAFDPTWSARIDRHDWQRDQDRLLVIDNKSGWTLPPPIHSNWQVRSEGALMTERLDAKETVVALIHPHHPDSLWEAKVYSKKDMLDLLDIVRHSVEQIQLPDMPRTPGGIQCQWCKAKRICPEYQAAAAALDQSIADEITDEGFTAIIRRSVDERGLHVAALKEQLKNIEFILNQYTDLATRDPQSVKGFVLKRQMRRSLRDQAQAMELIRKEYGDDILTEVMEVSLTGLEKRLGKTLGAKQAKASVERVLNVVLQFKPTKYYLEESRSL